MSHFQHRRKGKSNGSKVSREKCETKEISQMATIDESTTGEVKRKRQIVKWVRATLEKGPVGLRAEFMAMKRFNDFEKMKAFKEAQEFGKNRYKDVGCLDNNRVKLTAPWPHEYIHANYVGTHSSPKRFICTQAPLEKTCADFWHMCIQDRVENIFMLCNFTEKNVKKCYEYYPTKEKTLEFEEKGQKVSVRFESSSRVKWAKDVSAKVQETVLVVEESSGTSIRVNHYHWVDWPDRGVPDADTGIIELLAKARPSTSPIVVHCSAGIGRTGSVVMIEYIMDQLLSGLNIEEGDKILQKIRETRNNSIQTDSQYLFVHQIMLNYFSDMGLFDKKAKEAHKEFTAIYKKTVLDTVAK